MRGSGMDNLHYANYLIVTTLLNSRLVGAFLTSIIYATSTVLLLTCARRGSKRSVRESSLRQMLSEGGEPSRNGSHRSATARKQNPRTKRSVNSGSGQTEETKGPKRTDSSNGRRPPRSRLPSLRVNSTQRSSSTGVIKMALPSMPGVRTRSTHTSGATHSEDSKSSSLRVESTQTVTEAHKLRMDDEYDKIRELRRKLQRRLEHERRDKDRKQRSFDGKSDNDSKAKLPYGEASNRCRLAEASERKQRKSLVKKKDKKHTLDSTNSEREPRQSPRKTSGHKAAKQKLKKSVKDKSLDGRYERHHSKPPRSKEEGERDEEEQCQKKKKGKFNRSSPDKPKSSPSSDGGKRRKKPAKEIDKRTNHAKRNKSHH